MNNHEIRGGAVMEAADREHPDRRQDEENDWKAKYEKLKEDYIKLEDRSMIDEKSGIWNDKGLRTVGETLITEAQKLEGRFKLSFLVADVDDFKELNTKFGRTEVDKRIIKGIGKYFLDITRRTDVVARNGSAADETLVIFCASADEIMKKFQQTPLEIPIEINGETIMITFSAGIVDVNLDLPPAEALQDGWDRADKASAEAKKKKNLIVRS